MKKLTLGKSTNNSITIDHPTISRERHLDLDIDQDGKIIITHLGNNNTYIDELPIRKSVLLPEQNLIIGDYPISGHELIEKINSVINKSRTDFSPEFEILLPVLEEYEAKKSKIEKPSMLPIIIKISLTGIVFLVIYFTNVVSEELKYPLIIGTGMLATLTASFGNERNKKKRLLEDLELEYDEHLRCPKCRNPLLNFSSRKMKAKNQCLHKKCDATFELKKTDS